jgi:hypothetical protein
MKIVRTAILFSMAILIGVAASISGYQSRTAFWICIGLAGLCGIVAILTLKPIAKHLPFLARWARDAGGTESNPPADALPTPTVLPDGRAIHSCTLKWLAKIISTSTTDQASRLLLGKWVKFSGKIDDNRGNGWIWIFASGLPSNIRPLLASLQFGEGWEEQLSKLRRGSEITVRAQIISIDGGSVKMEGCELI